MPSQEPPSAITAPCPDCGEETLHSVLRGTLGTRGEHVTLDATVQCTECERTHHVVVREAKPIEVSAILSAGGASRSTKVEVPADEEVSLEEAFIVDGINALVTGIETKDMRRVERAEARDVRTFWLKEFEEVIVGFAINLGKKTITKRIAADPAEEFSVGEEHVFGRLRVTVHAIKTKERLLKRGTAYAADIVRIFARPTPLGGFRQRPDKRTREQLRTKQEDWS